MRGIVERLTQLISNMICKYIQLKRTNKLKKKIKRGKLVIRKGGRLVRVFSFRTKQTNDAWAIWRLAHYKLSISVNTENWQRSQVVSLLYTNMAEFKNFDSSVLEGHLKFREKKTVRNHFADAKCYNRVCVIFSYFMHFMSIPLPTFGLAFLRDH